MLVRGVAWRKQLEWRSALCSLLSALCRGGPPSRTLRVRWSVRPCLTPCLFVSVRCIRCGAWRIERHSQANPSVEGTGRAHPSSLSKFLFGKCVVHS